MITSKTIETAARELCRCEFISFDALPATHKLMWRNTVRAALAAVLPDLTSQAKLEGRIEGLKEARMIVETGAPEGLLNNGARCAHGQYYYESCEGCILDTIDSRLSSLQSTPSEDKT